jgi:vitamin B12 transporter
MAVRLLHPLLAQRRGFLLALLLAIPVSVFAAEEPSAQPTDIGEINVAGAREGESAEVPAAFTTVIRPAAFDRRAKSASELLSETVGLDVTSMGGVGALSTVSIRGSSAEEVAVFVDGVRIGSATTGAVDFSTIPVASIERIEVIRGAASARFGTDAIGGVINIVTKRAGTKRAIDLSLTGASFETLTTSESWLEPRDSWDMTLSHSHRSTAGNFTFKGAGITLAGGEIDDPATYTRLHNRSIAEDVLAKANIDLTERLHLAVSNDFFWTDREVPGMEIETTLLYPANPLEANEELFRTMTAVRLTADDLFTRGLTLETGITNSFDHDHFTDPSPALGDPIDVTNVSFAPEAFLLTTHEARIDPVSLTTTARYQYRYDHTSDSSPLAGAALMGTHARHTNALFVEEALGFVDDRLRFIPSARVEAATGRQTHASWRVGAAGAPLSWLEIKANVGTAFRYPTFSELYFPDQGYLRGNPNLDDERSFSWDAGVVVRPPRSRIEISYYWSRIDNEILFVPISATTIEPVNTGPSHAHGIEVSAEAHPFTWLHLDANYTWLDATFDGNGLRLPGRPQHKGNVRAEVTAGFATLFGELQAIGGFPINTANTVRITGHVAGNAGATLAFAKHFFATLEVKDVSNVQIYDARGFPLPRRSYWVTVGARTATKDEGREMKDEGHI